MLAKIYSILKAQSDTLTTIHLSERDHPAKYTIHIYQGQILLFSVCEWLCKSLRETERIYKPGVCSVIVTDGQRQMPTVTENTKVLTDVRAKNLHIQYKVHKG